MPLITDLKHFYKCDEASGNLLDAHGSIDLTVNGTGGIGSGTGIINGARDLEYSDSDYFSTADHDDFSIGDNDWAGWVWINVESLAGINNFVMGKDIANREWGVYLNSSGAIRFYVFSPASAFTEVVSSVTITTGSFFFVAFWHDSVNNEIAIRVNSTKTTQAYSAGVKDSTDDFQVGRGILNATFFDGMVDEIGIRKGSIPTDDDWDDLYDGGAGLPYPFDQSSGVIGTIFRSPVVRGAPVGRFY